MRTMVQRLPILLATCGVIFAIGCDSDSSRADKQAKAEIATAIADAGIGNDQAKTEARTALESAAKALDASPANRTQASAMLAQQRVDAAMRLFQKIDKAELKLSGVASQIRQLASQLDTGNMLVNDYSKYDPAPVRSQILTKVAEAQGGPDKPAWVQNDNASIPTLSAVKQKISALQGDLAKLDDSAKALTDQRSDLLMKADAASKDAENTKGQDSVTSFTHAAELQKQAADLYTQLDQVNAQKTPLQRDLEIAQGQQTVLEGVIHQFTDQLNALDTGWKSIREKLDAQQTLAREIVGESGGAAPDATTMPAELADSGATIAAKAATITRLAAEIQTMRQEAQSNLDDAAKYFNDATTTAAKLSAELSQRISDPNNSNRAEKPVWETLKAVMDPAVFKLREASARRALGSLYESEATSLNNRIDLAQAVEQSISKSGATMPADLKPEDLAKNFKQAVELAEQAFKTSDDLLSEIAEGATSAKETKESANVERILTLYGEAQVAKLNGSPKDAKKFLSDAIERRNAIEPGTPIPALPAELGTGPAVAMAPTATTSPSTEPTTSDSGAPATPTGSDSVPPTDPNAPATAPATAPNTGG